MVVPYMDENFPIAMGIGAVVIATLLAKVYYDRIRKKKTLLDPNIKYSLELIWRKQLNHDTMMYRFALPSKNHFLGLPIGQHIYLSAVIEGDLVVRPYTPVSSDEDLGFMDLVVKTYFCNQKFPKGGKMSQYLMHLDIGSCIDVRGPNGLLKYEGRNQFSIKENKKAEAQIVTAKKVSMIAGGSGITPMLQIISAIFRDPGDDTKISLLFANQSEEDILLRDELEKIQKENPHQFKIWYTVDRNSGDWQYSTGFINKDMISRALFPAGSDSIVLMCGPPPMLKFACYPNLELLGHNESRIFSF